MAKFFWGKFLTRVRIAVGTILLAIVIIAIAVYLATPPTPSPTPEVTPTVPAPTPAPQTPHPVVPAFKVEFDTASSYGFDRIYLYNGSVTPVFEISRGKSASIAVLVTSLVNETLNIYLDYIEEVPVGVELKMEPERFTLQPYEQIVLNLTVTVSPTARTSTPPPPATPETPAPGGPTPTPGSPETPAVTPTPIAADYIVVYLTTGGIVRSTGGWGGGGYGFFLSIV